MPPGSFPSPTPSRKSTPTPPTKNLNNPGSSSPCPPPSLNFTAPESMRKRPRFMEPSSTPNIPLCNNQTAIPTFFYPTTKKRDVDRRRASDTSYYRPQSTNGVRKHKSQRRVSSAPSSPSPPKRSTATPIPPTIPTQDATPAPTFISCQTINKTLHQKLSEPPTFSDAKGTIYLLHHPNHGIKIGITKRPDDQARIKEHKTTCGLGATRIATFAVTHYVFRTEQLIHRDLADRRRRWACYRHKSLAEEATVHGEWFDVDEEVALRTVGKWVDFMNQRQPYCWGGYLSPLWTYLLRARQRDEWDYDARRQGWVDMLVVPTWMEYMFFVCHVLLGGWHACTKQLLHVWPVCKAFCWQIATLVYSMVALVVFRNTWAAIPFVVVSVCVTCSIRPHFRLQLPKGTRYKKI
ncbi:hypothetical protein GQ44DRAFT_627378 [Phaeosphaeriaceae sp. PMI808]|nr:hypothetical protein GQ44DRAFT_627378 [Phaeosphaeriaceae sp. PMI808]